MIESGEKKEEYRAQTEYWRIRLLNWTKCGLRRKHCVVEFRLGYAKDAPRMVFIATDNGYRFGESRHPEWGEPKSDRFFIRLGDRVRLDGAER